MFISHIGAMDCFARGLRNASEIIKDGQFEKMLKGRYETYESDLGKKLENNESTLEEFEQYSL